MDGASSRQRSARSSRFLKLVACITATSGAQRKYQDQSSRHRLTPAACLVLPGRSGWPRDSYLHRAGPGRRGLGPRTSLQRLEPPDTTEVYQASGQGFGEGQDLKDAVIKTQAYVETLPKKARAGVSGVQSGRR